MATQLRAWRMLGKCFIPKLCPQPGYKHLDIKLFLMYDFSFRYGHNLQISLDILLGLISLDSTWPSHDSRASNLSMRGICQCSRQRNHASAPHGWPCFIVAIVWRGIPHIKVTPKLKMRKPSKRTQDNFFKRKIGFIYHSALLPPPPASPEILLRISLWDFLFPLLFQA